MSATAVLRTAVVRPSRVALPLAILWTLAAAACNGCNPVEPGGPTGSREVWMSPNVGSLDFLDLFSRPDAWTRARSKVTTIGFTGGALLDEPCSICGPNTLHAFLTVVPGGAFRWLASRNLKIAVGAASVKAWDCSAATTASQAIAGLENVSANGAAASFLAMDEPFTSGLPPNQNYAASMPTCGFTVAQTTTNVRSYVQRVQAAFPGVQIGLIEPYPYFSAAQIESFVASLSDAGVKLAFFHLDYDENFLSIDPTSDFLEFRSFFQKRQIPFGIIIIGTNGTSNVTAANGALVAALRISRTLGIRSQPHVLFESWLDYPPASPAQDLRLYPDNLPEDGQTTMTGLVNTVLETMP